MIKIVTWLAVAAAVLMNSVAYAQPDKPTIVLVHGAFADASSWNGVIKVLQEDGYPVIAAAIPMRSVKGDAAYVADILAGLKSSIVLVGHSYGGMVISEAAAGNAHVKALVYVSAFAPEAGETAAALSARFSGSTLGSTLAPPVALSGGGKDLYIRQGNFPAQFAADVPEGDAKAMAATQRPITLAALNEPAIYAAWKGIPTWFVYGDKDNNIPQQAFSFMAKRASARQIVVVKGASHVVMVSNPQIVAKVIESAAVETER
jgi:pimeloyl-ACP methyl ester carboxylesterase